MRAVKLLLAKYTGAKAALTSALGLLKCRVANGHAAAAHGAPPLSDIPHAHGHQGSSRQAANHAACGWCR